MTARIIVLIVWVCVGIPAGLTAGTISEVQRRRDRRDGIDSGHAIVFAWAVIVAVGWPLGVLVITGAGVVYAQIWLAATLVDRRRSASSQPTPTRKSSS